jgi:hypothetical protein
VRDRRDRSASGPTAAGILASVDEGWTGFWTALKALPAELLDVRVGEDGWTRKQMLAHITAWHDLTLDRLTEFNQTGTPVELPDASDAINARAARGAEGRTKGELIVAAEDSFRRLRREIVRLSDGQLAADGSWASAVIASNTYDHYREHLADLDPRRP